MPQDYYGTEDAGSASTATATPPESPAAADTSEDVTSSESESPVEVVSKSFFLGKNVKPGDRCTVEVTKVDEDSVLIKKIASNESADEEGAGDETSGPEEEGEGMMGPGMMGKPKSDYYA